MSYKITVLAGDGIGPEVIKETIKVFDKVGSKFGREFVYEECLIGGAAIDATGECLPQETIDKSLAADAVLLGAVGGPKWDSQPATNRPEKALLGIRKALNLYANLRPAVVFDELKDASPLKSEILDGGLDILIVRELTGGIYFGEHALEPATDEVTGEVAYDVEKYSQMEIRRIARVAFDLAMKRNKKVTSVDKANVLESSRLWRRTVAEVAAEYPEV